MGFGSWRAIQNNLVEGAAVPLCVAVKPRDIIQPNKRDIHVIVI